MQLDDVREQLRDLSARVPDGSTNVDETFARTRRAATRRRVSRAVAALAFVVVIGTLAVVINASRPASKVRVSVASPTTVASMPVPFTQAQLRAHDGVGVPRSWGPVDEGNARIWVPTSWMLEVPGMCVGPYGTLPSMVSVGKRAQAHCGTGPPAQSASVISSTSLHLGPLVRVVHGYRVYADAVATNTEGSRTYNVPQLGVQLSFRGALSDQILGTLAPSSLEVALAFAVRPIPKSYRSVTTDDVTLSIPSGWPVTGPGGYCSGLPSRPGLGRDDPSVVFSCPPPIPNVATFARDGVLVYIKAGQFGPQTTRPLIVLHHGASTVSAYADAGAGGGGRDDLELVVRRSGAAMGHELLLGLGRNGRIAGGILASLEATR